jgi:sugar/nucleoside kinase (ribokinase family)
MISEQGRNPKRLLGIGNALVDILVRIEDDRLLAELGLSKGGMTLIDRDGVRIILDKTAHLDHHKSSGGSSANTVTGLARLGMPVGFIGTVGDDEFGHFFRSDMLSMSVETHLYEGDSETGKSISLISADAERTMATFLGAANELFKCDIDGDVFRGYDYFLAEAYLIPYRELIDTVFQKAKKSGCEIVMDLSSFSTVEENRDYLDSLLSEYVDVVLANEDEARTFTKREDPREALAEIAKRCKIAVVKCGEKGSYIQHRSRQFRIDPISIKAIDSTGAGDLYAAGFMYGLMNGYSVEVSGKMGSCVGGKVVEVIGAKMHDQKWEEIAGLIQRCVVQ